VAVEERTVSTLFWKKVALQVHYKSQPEIETPRKAQKSTSVRSLTKKSVILAVFGT